jgi:hypothetical protein
MHCEICADDGFERVAVAIPGEVKAVPEVVTLTKKAPRQTAGQIRRPPRTKAATAIPAGGHTGEELGL